MRFKHVLLLLWLAPGLCSAQSKSSDSVLLEKMRPLYDTPFRRGLISFDCAIEFDFKKHIEANFGAPANITSPLFAILEPIHYRVFVDQSGATVSAQPKLPDLSKVPNAAQLEESNRQLMQFGLSNWVPHAAGQLLPLGRTKYHFDKTSDGYDLPSRETT